MKKLIFMAIVMMALMGYGQGGSKPVVRQITYVAQDEPPSRVTASVAPRSCK